MKIDNTFATFEANKITKPQAKTINNTLLNSSHVDIICHEGTDSDSANSALLMWEYLNQKGIDSRVILSQNLNTLKIRNKNCNIYQANTIKPNSDVDTVLCVDFSAYGKAPKNTVDLINRANNVVCIDHHIKQDMFDDCVEITQSLDKDELSKKTSLRYIDTSAKSATSVIYRLFESLGEEIDEDKAYDVFSGLVSDCVKKGLVDCDGKTGTITPKKELIKDKNAYEIYQDVESKISHENKKQIAKQIDIMSSLTQEEQEFYDSLPDRLQFSKDKKTAYIEIPPNDIEWLELGGDNTRTSAILNRFRQNILKDEKFENVNTAVVFYGANDAYRMSIHSKNKTLHDFYKLAYLKLQDKYNSFSTGGHRARGGGKIIPKGEIDCHNFVLDVIKCFEDYENL